MKLFCIEINSIVKMYRLTDMIFAAILDQIHLKLVIRGCSHPLSEILRAHLGSWCNMLVAGGQVLL